MVQVRFWSAKMAMRMHSAAAVRNVDESSASLPESLEVLATRTELAEGQSVYRAGDVADTWYRLVSGAAFECIQMADGRRQIVDFLLPGDLFGFCSHARHESSVEILVDGTVLKEYPRYQAEDLATIDADVARALRQQAFKAIERLQSRMVLLGRTNALEKVSAFLLEMSERTSVGASDDLVLPMSRYDVADYLAIAVETVSRTLTTLKARGAIVLANSRHMRIMDRRVLEGWVASRKVHLAAAEAGQQRPMDLGFGRARPIA
jgi:CRP/FNR family nitrogen fixation transcriptional regulator